MDAVHNPGPGRCARGDWHPRLRHVRDDTYCFALGDVAITPIIRLRILGVEILRLHVPYLLDHRAD